MKIGILSHPIRDNYGGILQSWALQQVLKGKGHHVELFGLKSKYPSILYPLIWIKRIMAKLSGRPHIAVLSEYRRWEKYHNSPIAKFINKEIPVYKLKSLSKIPEDRYDAIVVGSDQVWRREYIKSIWKCDNVAEAFLSDCSQQSLLRLAYSASFGVDEWEYTAKETDDIKAALALFKAVSVREYSGIDLLRKNVACEAQWMIDPTMLLTASDYRKLIRDNDLIGHKRVVSYILDDTEEKNTLIEEICRERGFGHIELNTVDMKGHKRSIQQWLGAIASAEMVVTDSFHGCVFSIIFNKPLVFMYNPNRGNARFDTLIKAFGIGDNVITPTQPYDSSKHYALPSDLQTRLNLYRERAMLFIDDSLRK